jgi:predicted transcriptional regulator
MNKIVRIGIASVQEQRTRALEIASGVRACTIDEPNVWFPSVSAMARVMSDENIALLKVIREQHPDSMDALAKSVGRQSANVSRSLRKLAVFGLVKLVRNGRTVTPEVTMERVIVDLA